MKKILLTIFPVILILGFVTHAYALTPTVAPSPSTTATSAESLDNKLNQQINQLKEKIASRVSELNLVEKRGIIGTVSQVSGNQVTMTDYEGRTRFIDVDEITKFSSPNANGTFGLSDLTKGVKISVLGLYNKQSKRILARFINSTVDPLFLDGVVSTIDTTNFGLTMISEDQKQIKVDVGTSTKISAYNKDVGLSKYGFSKINTGDKISIIGFPDKKDSTLFVASRIIIFPDLPKNPKIIIPELSQTSPSVSTNVTPSTKVTPTKKIFQ